MSEKILFSLKKCPKCTQTKQLLQDRDDIEIVTMPHDLNEWSVEQTKMVKEHNVFEDLQRTAPVLWNDGEKYLGYLRIRKWLQDNQ